MFPQRSQKQLSPRTIALVLTPVVIIIGMIEVNSLEARERAENPPQMLDGRTCFKCHNTPEELKKLRRKEGGSGFLFNKDGTPRNPEFVEYYRKQGFDYRNAPATGSYHSGANTLPSTYSTK